MSLVTGTPIEERLSYDQAVEEFGLPVKQCKKCLDYLPEAEEFFPLVTGKPDRFKAWCRACWSEYNTLRRGKPSEGRAPVLPVPVGAGI